MENVTGLIKKGILKVKDTAKRSEPKIERPDFEELVATYREEIFHYILSMVRNPDDALDLTQDCFLKAYRFYDSYRGEGTIRSWLYKIALNTTRNFFKHSAVRKRALDLKMEDARGFIGETPYDRVILRELKKKISDYVSELPALQKDVLNLRLNTSLSYGEIAEILDTTEESARVSFHYGIKRLRKLLEEDGFV